MLSRTQLGCLSDHHVFAVCVLGARSAAQQLVNLRIDVSLHYGVKPHEGKPDSPCD